MPGQRRRRRTRPERAEGGRRRGPGEERDPRREGDDVTDVRGEEAREPFAETVPGEHEEDVAGQGKDEPERDGAGVTTRGAARRPEGYREDQDRRQRLEDVDEGPAWAVVVPAHGEGGRYGRRGAQRDEGRRERHARERGPSVAARGLSGARASRRSRPSGARRRGRPRST